MDQLSGTIRTGLGGKTLGLIRLGCLGTTTAKIAKAFDMTIRAWSPNQTRERAEAEGVAFFPHKSRSSFYVRRRIDSHGLSTQHHLAPYLQGSVPHETNGYSHQNVSWIDHREKWPRQLITRGRDQRCRVGRVRTVVLPIDHPIRKLKNVTLTPHLGYVADELYKIFWEDTVDNILAYLDGTPKRIIEI